MKYLPSILQHLTLYLEGNNLVKNIENMKNLGKLIRYLPHNLQHLSLFLTRNNLGANSGEDIKYLTDNIKYLPKNLLNL